MPKPAKNGKRRQAAGNLPRPASPKKARSPAAPTVRWQTAGGQRLLVLANDYFHVEICPARGGAIVSYVHEPSGIDIIWRNPYGQPPRERLLDQPIAAGSDLFDVMDGSWYVSLPNGFFACEYFGAPLGTHGELRAIPWQVEHLVSTKEEVTVRLRGDSVRTPLVYIRELTVRRDSAQMAWRETVRNRSAEALPIAWLQHPTFGGTLLDGAKLLVPAKTVAVYAAENPDALQLRAGYSGHWPHVPERVGGALRDCSIIPAAGSGLDHSVQLRDFPEGWGCIWNAALHLGFALQWDAKVFPYAWSWANGGGIRHYPLWGEGHIITLQPSTSPVGRFPDLLKGEQLLTIPAQGEVSTWLTTGFVDNAKGPWPRIGK